VLRRDGLSLFEELRRREPGKARGWAPSTMSRSRLTVTLESSRGSMWSLTKSDFLVMPIDGNGHRAASNRNAPAGPGRHTDGRDHDRLAERFIKRPVEGRRRTPGGARNSFQGQSMVSGRTAPRGSVVNVVDRFFVGFPDHLEERRIL
jgi:hypothetical protein